MDKRNRRNHKETSNTTAGVGFPFRDGTRPPVEKKKKVEKRKEIKLAKRKIV